MVTFICQCTYNYTHIAQRQDHAFACGLNMHAFGLWKEVSGEDQEHATVPTTRAANYFSDNTMIKNYLNNQ